MKLAICNLYGIQDGKKAYYRKQGDCCFDFVNNPDCASDLSSNELKEVWEHRDWYCKQYGASHMVIE